jgi:hypothetical protein
MLTHGSRPRSSLDSARREALLPLARRCLTSSRCGTAGYGWAVAPSRWDRWFFAAVTKISHRDKLPACLAHRQPLLDAAQTVARCSLDGVHSPPASRTVIRMLAVGTRVAVLTDDDYVEAATASEFEALVQAAGLRSLAGAGNPSAAPVLGSVAGGPPVRRQGTRPVERWRAMVPWLIAVVAALEHLGLLSPALVRVTRARPLSAHYGLRPHELPHDRGQDREGANHASGGPAPTQHTSPGRGGYALSRQRAGVARTTARGRTPTLRSNG